MSFLLTHRPYSLRLLPFYSAGSLIRHFWKVSLKAKGFGHNRIGAQRVESAGNQTQGELCGQPG